MDVEIFLERGDERRGVVLLALRGERGEVALDELAHELVHALDVRVHGEGDRGAGLERVVLHREVKGRARGVLPRFERGRGGEIRGGGGEQARARGALVRLPRLLRRARLAEGAVELHRLLQLGRLRVVLLRLAVRALAAHEPRVILPGGGGGGAEGDPGEARVATSTEGDARERGGARAESDGRGVGRHR